MQEGCRPRRRPQASSRWRAMRGAMARSSCRKASAAGSAMQAAVACAGAETWDGLMLRLEAGATKGMPLWLRQAWPRSTRRAPAMGCPTWRSARQRRQSMRTLETLRVLVRARGSLTWEVGAAGGAWVGAGCTGGEGSVEVFMAGAAAELGRRMAARQD